MKKHTKFISLVLAVVLAVSCFASIAVFPASAEGEQKVYFEYPGSSVWTKDNLKVNGRSHLANVYCYAYAIYGNTSKYTCGWQTRTTQSFCEDWATDQNIFSFDLSTKGTIEDNADYGIIFSTAADGGKQTVDLTMTADCIGDTMYVTPYTDPNTGEVYTTRQNAADSHKVDYYAAWKNSTTCGPKATISSLGALLPGMFPAIQPKAQQLSNALKQYLTNPVNVGYFQYDNNMVLCEGLGVTPQEVYDQYMADNAPYIEGDPETDANVPCPFYRYMYINDEEEEVEGKLAAPEYVREVLGISDEEPTT